MNVPDFAAGKERSRKRKRTFDPPQRQMKEEEKINLNQQASTVNCKALAEISEWSEKTSRKKNKNFNESTSESSELSNSVKQLPDPFVSHHCSNAKPSSTHQRPVTRASSRVPLHDGFPLAAPVTTRVHSDSIVTSSDSGFSSISNKNQPVFPADKKNTAISPPAKKVSPPVVSRRRQSSHVETKKAPSRTRKRRSSPRLSIIRDDHFLSTDCYQLNQNNFEPGFYFPTKEVSFKNIGGYSVVKEELVQTVLTPFRRQMQSYIKKQPLTESEIVKGVLFWGPPGTGKTLMAKALAFECERDLQRSLPVYIINGAELLNKWVGESESRLRAIFHQAEENSPSMIFIDELDGLARRRNNADIEGVNFNMVSTLLTLLDGIHERGRVLVIATTNFKEAIDPAVLRSGRFDNKIYFPAPDESERSLILQAITTTWKFPVHAENLKTIARSTLDFMGADLNLLCRRAKIHCRERTRNALKKGALEDVEEAEVLTCDFFAALRKIRPSTSACNILPFQPLHERVAKLIQPRVNKIIDDICNHAPIRHSSVDSTCSAEFAKFCCSSMLLDLNPVIYIHSANDASLLSAVMQAIFHQLAKENSVRTFDFADDGSNRSLMADLSSILRQRQVVVGLFNVDWYRTPEADHIQLAAQLDDVLLRRDRTICPLLILSSLSSPEQFSPHFSEIFGKDVLVLEALAPTFDDCRNYFEEFLLTEPAKVVDPLGQIRVLEEANFDRKTYKKKLRKLARGLTNRQLDVILQYHSNLSRTLWKDRQNTQKTSFLKELDQVIAECCMAKNGNEK